MKRLIFSSNAGWKAPFASLFFCLLLAAGLFLPGTARSAIVRAMSLQDLTVRADGVVVGAVLGRASRWDSSGLRIVTDVELQVMEVWLGHTVPGDRIVLQVPGGEMEEIGQIVPGSPTILDGQHYVFFLRRHPDRVYTILGLSLGAFGLIPLSDGTLEARRDLSNLTQARQTDEGHLVMEAIPSVEWSLPLNILKKAVIEYGGKKP